MTTNGLSAPVAREVCAAHREAIKGDISVMSANVEKLFAFLDEQKSDQIKSLRSGNWQLIGIIITLALLVANLLKG